MCASGAWPVDATADGTPARTAHLSGALPVPPVWPCDLWVVWCTPATGCRWRARGRRCPDEESLPVLLGPPDRSESGAILGCYGLNRPARIVQDRPCHTIQKGLCKSGRLAANTDYDRMTANFRIPNSVLVPHPIP